MTREKAIEIFKDWIDEGVEYDDGYAVRKLCEEEEQAVIMAIQALSQEPICDRDCEHCTWTECPIEPCDDAVSRDAVLNIASLHTLTVNETVEAIKKLPSVTQKSETVTEFADRCRECGAKYGKLLKQKSGKWISEKVDGKDWKGCKRQYYQPISCSKCHSPNLYKSNYCPNCGADMREKAVEE